jgi:hypothetical protein
MLDQKEAYFLKGSRLFVFAPDDLRLTTKVCRYVYPSKAELFAVGGFTRRSLGIGGRSLSSLVPQSGT